MMRIITPVLISLALLFGAVTTVSAQATPDAPPSIVSAPSYLDSVPFGGTPADKATGNANCFDYYRFGSVVTNIAPSTPNTTPGATMTFSGTITNENSYPVVGLDLYVKIFRKQTTSDNVKMNGHHLVAQFVAVKGIAIDASSAHPFSFDWTVPTGSIPGEYMIATYAMTNESYNLSGLSFTDDVTGAVTPFSVGGTSLGGVFWDKNKVMMNTQSFRFAAFISQFPKEEAVTVSAPLMNTTATAQTVTLTWKQYSWDGLKESQLVDTKTETLTLPPNTTKNMSYVATKYKGSVTYIVADVMAGDTHSILDMRFARTGVEQARINFPSLTSFPLVKGQLNTLFSCLHVAGPSTLSDGVLTLALTDAKGKTITTNTYKGNITGAMMGVAYPFTPTKSYDKVTLTATLSRGGVVEDVGSVTYDCNAIDSSKCFPKEKSMTGVFLLLFVVVLALVIGVVLWNKKKTPLAVVALLLLCGAVFGGHPTIAKADTTSWTSGTFGGQEMMAYPDCVGFPDRCLDNRNYGPITPSNPNLYRNSGSTGEGKLEFRLYAVTRFNGIQSTVNYFADAKKGMTTLINGVSVLNVGDTIDFVPVFSDTDISWIETGFYSDSPYGQWGVDGQHGCRVADRVWSESGRPNYGDVALYASHQIPKPTVTLTGVSANLSCVGLSCAVTGAGPISATVTYAPTTGVIYGASSKTITAYGLAYYYQAGCLSSSLPLMDYAKLSAYSSCGLDTEDGDIACYNNATNMELTIAVPQKTIPFSFSAIAPVPIVTTVVADTITNTSANLKGTGNPNGDSSTGWFRYSSTNPGSCNDVFGTRLPATGGTALGSGSSAVAYNRSTGTTLSPGITYYYCAIASNSSGKGYGSVLNFKTLAPPAVSTVAATSLNPTSAVINGLGNPNSDATTAKFRWGTSNVSCASLPSSGNATTPAGGALGSTPGNYPFSRTLSGLTAGVTYYFCAQGTNSNGTSQGAVLSFTTPLSPPPALPPSVSTVAASSIGVTTATINGLGNPNGDATTASFHWSTTNAACHLLSSMNYASNPAGGALGNGNSNKSFSLNLSGLSAGTTYYFCARGQNVNGWGNGSVLTFTTATPPPPGSPPTVTTDDATNLDMNSATINGTGNPMGDATTASFHWGTSPAACHLLPSMNYASNPAGGALGNGNSNKSFSLDLSGLSDGTTYYYCARAKNSNPTWANGSVLSFTTPSSPPPPPGPDVYVTATINGEPSAIIPNNGNFRLVMDSSNATQCQWSRWTNGSMDWNWTNIPPGTGVLSYDKSFSGWSGPNVYRWAFYCYNNSGGRSGGAAVDLTILPPEPVIQITGVTNFLDTIVGNISTRTFTVKNVGGAGSFLTGVVTPTSGVEFYCTAGCSYTNLIPGGASQTVTVTFAPSDIGGRSGAVDFSGATSGSCNGSPGTSCTMTGNGLSPILAVPDPLNFGDVVLTKSKTLRMAIRNISNTAIPPFTITNISGDISCPQCSVSVGIPALGTRFVDITFAPTIVGPFDLKWALLFGPGRTEKFEIIGNGVPPIWSVKEQ